MMWTEAAIKRELDGLFFSFNADGRVIARAVANDFIPTHDGMLVEREMTTSKRWSETEDATLLGLLVAGVSHPDIADELERSLDSVKRRITTLRKRGTATI